MKNIKILLLIAGFLGLFLFAFPPNRVAAQDSPINETPLPRGNITSVQEETPPPEVQQDSQISVDAGIAPKGFFGKLLHRVEKAAEKVTEAVTFNPEKKAALKAKHALERVAEAQVLIKEGQQDQAEKLIEEFENKFEEAADTFEKSKPKQNKESAEKFLEEFTKRQVEANRVLDNLIDPETVKEEIIDRVFDSKEKIIERFSEVVEKTELPKEVVAQRIQQAIEAVPGSELKHFKNIEILQAVEEKISSEQAKEAIARAKQKSLERLEEQINNLPRELRQKKLEAYINNLPGLETSSFEVLDEMKTNLDVPPEVLTHMEEIKAKMAERFAERFKKIQRADLREKMFRPFENGDFEDIRALDAFVQHLPSEEVRKAVEQKQREALKKFREKFANDDNALTIADKAEQLMREIRQNPNPATFKLLEELKEGLSPEQQAFIEEMEQKGREEFERRMREEGEKFLFRVTDANPEYIEFFKEFEQGFPEFGPPPPEIREMIEKAQELQVENFKRRLEIIERPEDVEDFQKRFEQEVPDSIRKEILQRIPDFQDRIEQQREFVNEHQRRLKEMRRQMEEGGLPASPPEGFPHNFGPEDEPPSEEFLEKNSPEFPPPGFDEGLKEGFDEDRLPPGFDKGEKEGFEGSSVPPGFQEPRFDSEEEFQKPRHEEFIPPEETTTPRPTFKPPSALKRDLAPSAPELPAPPQTSETPPETNFAPPTDSALSPDSTFVPPPEGEVQGISTTKKPFWSIFLP